jgi:TetR/AcrR family transcriptional regulator
MQADNKKSRRRGTETSASRTALIDAAEQLIFEDGYAAVSTRRLASRAGLKPQLVHYYFPTMDDLFVALVRRGGDRALESMAKALASPQPLRAVMNVGSDTRTARMAVEMMALAHHRKAIRTEVKRYTEQLRIVQSAALARQFELRGGDMGIEPVTAVTLTAAAANMLSMEASLGISLGHAETRAFIEKRLSTAEYDVRTAKTPSRVPGRAVSKAVPRAAPGTRAKKR